MKNLIELFHDHVTIAKVTCLALLFSPLLGLWWFNIDSDFLQAWMEYLLKGISVAIVYTSVCILAVMGFRYRDLYPPWDHSGAFDAPHVDRLGV